MFGGLKIFVKKEGIVYNESMNELKTEKQKAILIRVSQEAETEDDFGELKELADTAGYDACATMTQRRDRPDHTYYIGTGKLEELKEAVNALDVGTVIFDNDVSAGQLNNLEKEIKIPVIDRATLILEIFAAHATSNEGKLQVELAQKKHSLPRVLGQGMILSRTGGGGGGGKGARRGAGEQQLELDRRTIREEIRELERKIEKLSQARRLRRGKRQKSEIKSVCIVGYTNAGKSTLMNSLTKAGVLEKDMLFATLDPVSRKFWLAPKKEFVLTDTVGFISRLPHEFIEAFKSTLEETSDADLILLVADASDSAMNEKIDVVREVLSSIGAEEVPCLVVYNKIDKIAYDRSLADNGVCISAKKGDGIEKLKEEICFRLFGEKISW